MIVVLGCSFMSKTEVGPTFNMISESRGYTVLNVEIQVFTPNLFGNEFGAGGGGLTGQGDVLTTALSNTP